VGFIKAIARFIWKHLDAWAGEAFTFVGLIIAWILVEPGNTRSTIAIICIGAFVIWTLFKVTLSFEEKKDDL
jgi:hypothetical protein